MGPQWHQVSLLLHTHTEEIYRNKIRSFTLVFFFYVLESTFVSFNPLLCPQQLSIRQLYNKCLFFVPFCHEYQLHSCLSNSILHSISSSTLHSLQRSSLFIYFLTENECTLMRLLKCFPLKKPLSRALINPFLSPCAFDLKHSLEWMTFTVASKWSKEVKSLYFSIHSIDDERGCWLN